MAHHGELPAMGRGKEEVVQVRRAYDRFMVDLLQCYQ